jgi:ATP-dependent exoDNAse (exonuclease V) beta subunit
MTVAIKTKAHQIYRKKDGTIVPGATTVLQELNKPALVKWANNLGLQGIDSTKYVDKMASIGTLAHQMVHDYFKGQATDTSEYSPDDVSKAENCMISFYNWADENEIEPILLEAPLVSEIYGFGGTIDCYCRLNGTPTLLDFKTSKAIWPEHFYQVAAYKQLLFENDYTTLQVRILRIGRDETEGFEDHVVTHLFTNWNIFEAALNIYNYKKQLKAGE